MTGRLHRDRNGGQDLARLECGEVGALVEVGGGDIAASVRTFEAVGGTQRHHHGGHVVTRVTIGDIATERAHIANLRIGDHQRRLLQDRQMGGDLRASDDLVLGCHRADDQRIAVATDSLELADAGKIDQMLRRCKTQLHHWNEAVTAGQRTGLVAQFGQQFDGIGERCRPMILEFAWNHGLLPFVGLASATTMEEGCSCFS